MGRILALACLVTAIAPSAVAQAQQIAPNSPFLGGARADVNELGQAVVGWAGPHGVRAAIGDRAGFGPVTVLSAGADAAEAPQVAIDGAGDAIVVWETKRVLPARNCATCDPRTASAGVFASLRRAGGAFGSPVQLAAAAPDTGAEFQLDTPKLAMSSTGHAVIAWTDSAGVAVASRVPGSDIGAPQHVAPAGFVVNSAAIGGEGTALLGDSTGHVVVRPAGGAFGAPQPLPGATLLAGRNVYVAANTTGDALAAYDGGTGLMVDRRPAGGDWGAPVAFDAPLGSGLRGAVLSDSGAGAAQYIESFDPRTGRNNVVFTALSPAAGGPLSLEAASRDDLAADPAFDGSGLDTDAGGDVAVAFDRFDIQNLFFGRHVAQVAVRRVGGAFGAPVTLTPPQATGHASLDTADAAIDDRGELLATWADHYPGQIRVMARWFTPDGGAGPPLALDGAAVQELVLPPAKPARGHAAQVDTRFRLRVSASGRVAVALRCVSNDRRACRGTLRLTYGARKRTAGLARFSVPANRRRHVAVALHARVRRTLLRLGDLSMTAVAQTTRPNGGQGRFAAPLTVSAPANARKATLRVTSRALPANAVYTEGAIQFAALYRENGSAPVITTSSRRGPLHLARRLAPGGYRLDSWTRTCEGNCSALDPPAENCSLEFRVGAAAVRRYEIRTRVGHHCRIAAPR